MSWNLSRIRTYADSVVHHAGQAVVVGAKLLHIGSRNVQSFQETVKRLEEHSVSKRGSERVLMLRTWLHLLRQVEDYNTGLIDVDGRNEETGECSPMVFYQDNDQRGEIVTFLDVFLHSEALEGIGISMIHEAPNDEEVALILEIFRHCLMGGKQVHSTILSSIQDLSKAFSCYHDEVLARKIKRATDMKAMLKSLLGIAIFEKLVFASGGIVIMKREELLQFAQSSITGLKISAEQARIDAEVTTLEIQLMKEIQIPSREAHSKSSEELDVARTQALKEALSRVRLYSMLRALLLRRKYLRHGDSPEVHDQKIDKLQILSQSLAHSSTQAQKRMEDHRHRREEALSYRVIKVNEVTQVEKDLLAEIGKLKQRRDELEAELKKVNSSIAAANARLGIAREENQHFDKANSDILHHFQNKEQELLRSVALCQTETEVASAWIRFIESTWCLQCTFTKQKEELSHVELGKYTQRFVSILMQVLPIYKNELSISVNSFKEIVQKLQDMSDDHSLSLDDKALRSAKRKDKLEKEYHDSDSKLKSAFSIVENIKQLLAQSEEFYSKDDQNVEELIIDLQTVKEDYESVERPDLRVVTPTTARWKRITKKLGSKETRERLQLLNAEHSKKQQQQQQQQQQHHEADNQNNTYNQGPVIDGQELLDSDDELPAYGSGYVTVTRDHAAQELNDWEV